MYCKHCGTQLADWQKTCHICGTPVDSDAKKTFLDDIDFSETEVYRMQLMRMKARQKSLT